VRQNHALILSYSVISHCIRTTPGLGRLAAGIAGDRIGAVNTIVPSTLLAAVMTFAWPFAGRTLVGTIVLAVVYGYVSLDMPITFDSADRLHPVVLCDLNSFSSGTYVALLVVPIAHMGDHRDVGRRTGMQNTILAFGALAGTFLPS